LALLCALRFAARKPSAGACAARPWLVMCAPLRYAHAFGGWPRTASLALLCALRFAARKPSAGACAPRPWLVMCAPLRYAQAFGRCSRTASLALLCALRFAARKPSAERKRLRRNFPGIPARLALLGSLHAGLSSVVPRDSVECVRRFISSSPKWVHWTRGQDPSPPLERRQRYEDEWHRLESLCHKSD
jgi:hypothetical protein